MMLDRRERAIAVVRQLLRRATDMFLASRPPTQYSITRRRPEKLLYDDHGFPSGFQGEEEYTTSEFQPIPWVTKDFENADEYNYALTELAKIFGKEETDLRDILSKFVADALVPDKSTQSKEEALLRDLEGRPVRCNLTVGIINLIPEGEEITIREGTIIRKITKNDLSYEPNTADWLVRIGRVRPHSVMELTYWSNESEDSTTLVERLLASLCLYKVAAVYYTTIKECWESYARSNPTSSRTFQIGHEPRVILKSAEADKIFEFVASVLPMIPSSVIGRNPVDPVEVSLNRYLDSLRLNVPIEERLTNAVMGLEALFLESETELRFRLAVRIARLMGHLDEQADEVFRKVSDGYNLRSAHVHGSTLSSDERKNAQEILGKIWNYLRKAILVYLSEDITSRDKKKTFLKSIDTALIDDTASTSLKNRTERIKNKLRPGFS